MPNDAVNILINYDDIYRFIPEIKQRNELLYVLRNKDVLKEYNNLWNMSSELNDEVLQAYMLFLNEIKRKLPNLSATFLFLVIIFPLWHKLYNVCLVVELSLGRIDFSF